MTRLLKHARYEELKTAAGDLVEDYELTYPLDPRDIALTLGIRISVYSDWHPVFESLCKSRDGFTSRTRGSSGWKFVSHINGAMAPSRQRFTIMHEISHILLDHFLERGVTDPETAEAEANFLAGYLLAPDVLIVMWEPGLTIEDIARTFDISEEAAAHSHRRVLRAINRGALESEYDQRIANSASLRPFIASVPGSA